MPLLLGVLFGCADDLGETTEPPAGHDHGDPRIDLTTVLPSVETLDGLAAGVEPYSTSAAEAGQNRFDAAVVVADRRLGSGVPDPRRPGRHDVRLADKARTVEHPAHLALVWHLSPAADSLLTFRPAVPFRPYCRAEYRWSLRRDGTQQLVSTTEVGGEPVWESAEVAVDLSTHLSASGGREIELVAHGAMRSLRQGESCDDERLGWITPTVWNRQPRPARERSMPSVVVLGLDTVRADHLGAWGRLDAGSPSPTPALDRLAAESDVFVNAFSTFNVTNPSFASIHTGLYGKSHGVYDLNQPLADDALTWAEIYRRRGYVTQAVVAATHLQPENSGLGQGFDGVHRPWGQYAAEEVVRRGLHWLDSAHDVDYPFFLWLHFFDAHTPHVGPLPYALGLAADGDYGIEPVAGWRSLRPEGLLTHTVPELGAHPELYASDLAYLDRQIGRLIDSLDRRGLLRSTWIVVVADHGENLTEHGLLCRHTGLWDTTTHVPLMIRPPGPRGRPGRRFDQLVQTLDLFPTLLRATGIEPPPSDGLDLYELVTAGGRPEVFAEHANRLGAMVRTRTHAYIRHWRGNRNLEPGVYFYDLPADPRQENNLAGRGLAQEAVLAARLDAWLEGAAEYEPREAEPLDDAEREQLRALGYLDD